MSPPPWIVGSAESDVRDQMRSGYLRPFLAHIGNSGPRDAMWLARPGGTPGLVSQAASLVVSGRRSVERRVPESQWCCLVSPGSATRRSATLSSAPSVKVRPRQLFSLHECGFTWWSLVLCEKRKVHHIKNLQREFLGDRNVNT